MAKEKCLLDLNPWERDKRLFDGGVGAPPNVVEAYIGEAAWLTKPNEDQMGRHPRAFSQYEGIVAYYGLGCYSVASAMQ